MSVLEQAHREAVRLPIATLAEKLQEMLGQRLTAYAVAIKDPKSIGKYARGDGKPREEPERRLRELFQICFVLGEPADVVRAWMIGSNPLLDDQAPIEVLREGALHPVMRTAQSDGRNESDPPPPESFGPVSKAAQAFATANG